MYAFKNFVHMLMTPLAMASILAVAGAILRVFRLRRAARAALILALAIGYLGSTSLVGDALLGPLERRYPPLSLDAALDGTAYVVVLGSGYAPIDHIPVTAALDKDGLVRVVEAIRISRRLRDPHLVVSGGAPPGNTPSAFGYAALADDLGVDVPRADVLSTPLDTSEEAQALAALIGRAPFILVTSAYHMPRAMRLMLRAGLKPIPAPTGQRVGVPPISWLRLLIPTSSGLQKTELALHEYAGFLAMSAGIS
jgi:uncharacterized SAM-binding protein YcdF (DUF218 family)